MPDEVENTGGLSRRSMIKRVSAGAAVVWSAPAILSVSRASAAASPNPCTNGGDACEGLFACGDNCNCWVNASGGGNFCGFLAFSCSDTNACTGSDGTDCPSGYNCVATCCGNICVAPCGSNLAPLAEADGPRTTR